MADLLHGPNRWGAPISGLTGPNNCARECGFDGGWGPRGGRPAGRATAQRGHCRLFGWTSSVATPRVRRLHPREQVVVAVSELICRHTHHTHSLTPHAILPTSKLRSSTTYPSLLSAHLLQPILYCYLLICRNTVG